MSEKGSIKFTKYKHLIFAIVIIIIVIVLDIMFENYTKSSIQIINNTLGKISNCFEEQEDNYDVKKLEKLSKNVTEDWEKREKLLTCFVEHEEIEKISVKLHLLNTQIKNKIWSDAECTTTETKQLVKYLNTKHKLSLQNIF